MESELHQLICNAFSDTRPPTRPVTGHICEECNEVDALLGDRTWPDVATDFPSYCHDAFPLLTPDAQVYFLPAYMLVALTPEAGMQGISLESALGDGGLTPDKFTPAQRAAVVSWALTYWQLIEGSEPPATLLERWRVEN